MSRRRGILRRELRAPRFLSEAGDLAVGAVALVMSSWRSLVPAALILGVPATGGLLALERFGVGGPARGFAETSLLVLFVPVAAGIACLVMEAEASGGRARPGEVVARVVRCWPRLIVVAAPALLVLSLGSGVVHVPGILNDGWITRAIVVALASALFALVLPAVPAVLEGRGVRDAVGAAVRGPGAMPALLAAVALVILLAWPLREVVVTLAEAPRCAGCDQLRAWTNARTPQLPLYCKARWELGLRWVALLPASLLPALALMAHRRDDPRVTP